MNFIIKILISTLAVLVSAYLLPGVEIRNNNFGTAAVVALVLAFLNSVIRPLLILLTIPITFFTLGLFLLVINAGMILLAAKLIDDFVVTGFWPALWFSIIMSVITSIFEAIQRREDRRKRGY
jgi:putative membrane protein